MNALAISKDDRLERVRALARLLDNAVRIPGTRFRIGLDPILGLVPGIGDLLCALLAGFIVLEAEQLGASRSVLWRMLFNILVDTLLGATPVVGDVIDAAWKANAKNLELLEAHLRDPRGTQAASRRFVAVGVAALALFAAGTGILAYFAIRFLMRSVPR